VTVHICRSHICDRRGQRLTRRSARPPHLLVHVACSADPEHSALTTPPHDPAITSVESRVSLPAHERLAMLKLKLALSRPHRPGLCIVRGVRGHGCRRLRLAVVRAAPALRPELRQGCRRPLPARRGCTPPTHTSATRCRLPDTRLRPQDFSAERHDVLADELAAA
jgi:hypothetical protein